MLALLVGVAHAREDQVGVDRRRIVGRALLKGNVAEIEAHGEVPKASDEVEVIYEGRLIDGTVFDATSKHGGSKTDKFRANGLIKGWTEALTLMPVGSKWQLYIPYELAYGERQAGQIPPYSTLVFDLELVSIVKPEVKPEPADKQKEDAAVKSADKKVVKPVAKKAAHSKKRK